jgi:alpha-1,3-rhamnosyl/mannosyltransferase
LRRAIVRRFPVLHHLRRLDPRRIVPTVRDAAAIVAAIRRRRQATGLTIAVDGNALFEPLTGVGWYLANVLRELAADPTVTLRLYGPELIAGPAAPGPQVALPPQVEHVIHRLSADGVIPPHWIQKASRLFWPVLVAADRNRLVFAPNFLIRPDFRLLRAPLVATVHDLASQLAADTLQLETRRNLEHGLNQVLERAVTVVVPSEAVRTELVATGKRTQGNVVAVHHGPGHNLGSDRTPRAPAWATGRFVLAVGTIEPRKNLGVLLDAFELLISRDPVSRDPVARDPVARDSTPPRLVLAGKLGWNSAELVPRLEAAERAGWLVRSGYLELEELLGLYQACELVLFPSRYEGFGLPAVEAFQAGKPLIASDIPVLREVAGDAAAFAPPGDPEAWASLITDLLGDPVKRDALATRGRERLTHFDWRRSAAAHRAVFEAAVAGVLR